MDGEKKSARIIDFHSHVLPGLDDGSKDKAMTREILTQTYGQKVRKMVATPHFYPDSMSLPSFLSLRQEAAEALLTVWDRDTCPRVFLGAEVAFFNGIGESDSLKKLTVAGTDTLLLEMPYSHWSDKTVEEVASLPSDQELRVVLAHAERYLSLQKAGTLEYLVSRGIYIQSNASFFLGERKDEALDMLKRGMIHVIGSDTHNTSTRRQRIGDAREVIRNSAGKEALETLLSNTRLLLDGALALDQM